MFRLNIKGCRVDTNLLSVEELDNWCFGDIKVIAETLGISVPVCRSRQCA